jgi:hypothetical protein
VTWRASSAWPYEMDKEDKTNISDALDLVNLVKKVELGAFSSPLDVLLAVRKAGWVSRTTSRTATRA